MTIKDLKNKKILICLLVVAVCVAVALSFFSEGWVEVGRDDIYIVLIDKTSIEEKNNRIRVWKKYIFQSEKAISLMQAKLGRRPACSLNYAEYDENNNTVRNLSQTFYAKDGTIIWITIVPDPPSKIVPGSNGEDIFNAVKKYNKRFFGIF